MGARNWFEYRHSSVPARHCAGSFFNSIGSSSSQYTQRPSAESSAVDLDLDLKQGPGRHRRDNHVFSATRVRDLIGEIPGPEASVGESLQG